MIHLDMSTVHAACAEEESIGVCLSCGETQDGCEPDARGYECDSCGARKVYGIPEALLMGEIIIEPDDDDLGEHLHETLGALFG